MKQNYESPRVIEFGNVNRLTAALGPSQAVDYVYNAQGVPEHTLTGSNDADPCEIPGGCPSPTVPS